MADMSDDGGFPGPRPLGGGNAIQVARSKQAEAIEATVIQGDLSKLNAGERTAYYKSVCDSLGLNPLTQPFEYLTLNNKLRLYARRDCTDQLRKIHTVSIRIVAREKLEDCYVVTAQASLPNGRTDESIGVVPTQNLKGENLANALMKAETKAKRRVTLAICGLAVLDESELEGVGVPEPPPRKPGSGAPVATPSNISPHLYPDEDPDAPRNPNEEGDRLYEAIIRRFASLEEQTAKAVSYDDILLVRAQLGSKAKPSQLTREIQTAREKNMLDHIQGKELGRAWQRLDRQVTKKEAELRTDAASSFSDADPDPSNPNEEPT